MDDKIKSVLYDNDNEGTLVNDTTHSVMFGDHIYVGYGSDSADISRRRYDLDLQMAKIEPNKPLEEAKYQKELFRQERGLAESAFDKNVGPVWDKVKNVGKGIASLALNLPKGLYTGAEIGGATIPFSLEKMGYEMKAKFLSLSDADKKEYDEVQKKLNEMVDMDKAIKQTIGELSKANNQYKDYINKKLGLKQNLWGDIGNGLGSVGVGIATAILTKSPEAITTIFAADQYGQLMGENVEAGKDLTKSTVVSGGVATVVGTLERFGLQNLLENIATKTVGKAILKSSMTEGITESSQQLVEDIAMKDVRKMGWSDIANDVSYNGFIGVVTGGAVGGIGQAGYNGYKNHIVNKLQDKGLSKDDAESAFAYMHSGDEALLNKVRDLEQSGKEKFTPEAIAEFSKRVAEDKSLSDNIPPPIVIKSTFDILNDKQATLENINQVLNESMDPVNFEGGDIDKLVEKVKKTQEATLEAIPFELENVLKQSEINMKKVPDIQEVEGMIIDKKRTPKLAGLLFQQEEPVKSIKEVVGLVGKNVDIIANENTKVELKEIKDDFKKMFLTKFDEEQADAQAQVAMAMAFSKARVLGVSPKEYMAKYAPKVNINAPRQIIKKDVSDKYEVLQRNETSQKQLNIEQAKEGESFVRLKGEKVPVEYKIVEASDLITSNDEMGYTNENYPQYLQNRDRSRLGLRKQVEDIAKSIEPERLGENVVATEGAPILTQDGFVAIGNGRATAIKLAYKNGTAQGYKEYLESKGYDTKDFKQPVLIRQFKNTYNQETMKTLIQEANVAGTSQFSISEQALDDANKLSKETINLYDTLFDIDAKENREFVIKAFNEIVNDSEKARYLDDDGFLTNDGIKRIKNATLAYVLPNKRLLSSILETEDEVLRKASKAVVEVSPKLVSFEQEIEKGNIGKEYTIMDDIRTAFELYTAAKRSGQPLKLYINNLDMFKEYTDGQIAMTNWFIDSRNSGELKNRIERYIDNATHEGDTHQIGMFGEPVSKEQIIKQISEKKGETLKQVSIFSEDYDSVDIKELRERTKKIMMDNRGDITHPVLGKIRILRKGIKESLNYSANKDKLYSLLHLKDILETSAVGEKEQLKHPRKDGIVAFYPLYNKLDIQGHEYLSTIKIGVDTKGNLYYTLLLNDPKGIEFLPTKYSVNSDGVNISLIDFYDKSNKKDKIILMLKQGQTEKKGETLKQETIEPEIKLSKNEIEVADRNRKEFGVDGAINLFKRTQNMFNEELKKTENKELVEMYQKRINSLQAQIDWLKGGGKITTDKKSVDNKINKKAKKYFGITENTKEAAYIISDGSMLDFSGKKFGGEPNTRTMDHREISAAFEETGFDVGMEDFIDNGNIRYMPESNTFLMSSKPTSEQFYVMQRISDGVNGEINVECVEKAEDWGMNIGFYREYNKGTDFKNIQRDINSYFNTGKVSEINMFYQRGQSVLGQYNTATRVIDLFEKANATTFIHENTHDYVNMLLDARDKGNERAKEQLKHIDNWLGHTQGAYTENEQERIARGAEVYLFEGKAPNTMLANVFESFKRWLVDIYNNIKNIKVNKRPVRLNDEIRAFYREMLGGKDIDKVFAGDETLVQIEQKLDALEKARQNLLKDREQNVKAVADILANKEENITTIDKGVAYFNDKVDTYHKFEKATERGFEPVSTRARKISPAFMLRIRQSMRDRNAMSNNAMREIKPFLDAVEKTGKGDKKRVDVYMKNGLMENVKEILAKHNIDESLLTKYRETMDDIYNKALSVGIKMDYRPNYAPRKVKDTKGFFEYIRHRNAGLITQMEQEIGKDATQEAKADWLDKHIMLYNRGVEEQKVGNIKERTIDVVGADLDRFYYTTPEAIEMYIDGMSSAITMRKLFGATREINEYGTNDGLDATVGATIAELQEQGKITTNEQMDEVRELMNSLFGNHGKQEKWLSAMKNGSYTVLLTRFSSTITQLEDLGKSVYKNGTLNTLKAFFGRDFTLENTEVELLSEEYRKSYNKFSSLLYKLSGFSQMDKMMKENYLNGRWLYYREQATKDIKGLRDYLEPMFEERTNDLIEAIKKGDTNNEEVKLLMFNELSDIQPISLAEMPTGYINHPNGRVLYMLKTFAIRQLDFVLNETLREYKKGHKIQAVKNLVALSVLMGSFRALADAIRNFVRHRENDIEQSVLDSWLGIFLISRYQLYKARAEGAEGFVASFIPPLFPATQALLKSLPKLISGKTDIEDSDFFMYTPLIGDIYYWNFGGGREKELKRQKK